jgi:hypothetical protein
VIGAVTGVTLRMFPQFEQRGSVCIHRARRVVPQLLAGTVYSMAGAELRVRAARVDGCAHVILRGRVTRASLVDCQAVGAWCGVDFAGGCS